MATRAEQLVIDTGPLVALAKAGALDVMTGLPFEFVCPPEVRSELKTGADPEHVTVAPGWLTTLPLRRPLDPVATTILDAGEASVIQLALDEGIRCVCIDERRGRQFAIAVGLDVVGTLGLLLRAKRIGRIEALHPFVERLQRAGEWYGEDLLHRVLLAAGEQPL